MSNSDTSNMHAFVSDYISKLQDTLQHLPLGGIVQLIEAFKKARANDQSIFVVGNGGSATTATHFATDIGKGASLDQPKRFRILSLTDNVGWMTALGNDLSYDDIFVEQLKNYAKPGDLVVAISVSGNSPNAVKAVEWANENGCQTFALVGAQGGRLKEMADVSIVVPTEHFGRAEDAHLVITHIVGYYLMEVDNLPTISE